MSVLYEVMTISEVEGLIAAGWQVQSGPCLTKKECEQATLCNGPQEVCSSRTLGYGHTEAAAGDDPRLSDARTPVGTHLLSGYVYYGIGGLAAPTLLSSLISGGGPTTPGVYNLADVTVNATGGVTAIASGSGGSPGWTLWDVLAFAAAN